MMIVPLIPLTVLVGMISLGYIIFGVYLIYRYDGIGVQSLSLFSILWGGKFILGSVAFYVLASNGVTGAV